MLGRHLGLILTLCLSSSVLGCEVGGSPPDSGGGGMDAGGGGVDSGPPMACATAADCDDGHECTLEECVVGNVCEYTTLDARCAAGQRCVAGRGCVTGTPSDCTDASDCQDGEACNGEEICIREMCIPGDAVDCNDNNECTVDTCVEPGGSCTYDVAPGCDAGVGPVFDAGPGCDPFDAATDYTGSWRIAPSVACDPGGGRGYSLSMASFSVSGGTLTVTMGSLTLTQSPAPTGPDFDVTGSDGCANARLMGTMECDRRFSAMWTASHSGTCGVCGTTSSMVAGRL